MGLVELMGGACLILGIVPRYVALLLIPEILGTVAAGNTRNLGGCVICAIFASRWHLDGNSFPGFAGFLIATPAGTLSAAFMKAASGWITELRNSGRCPTSRSLLSDARKVVTT
jgi:uncharacterized membrane protein YphA (DoxX/SURF4 family)